MNCRCTPRVQKDCARRRFANAKKHDASTGGKVYDLPSLGDTAYVWLPDNATADLAGPRMGTGVRLGVLRGADTVWISYNPVPSTPTNALGAEIEVAKVILAGVR